MNELTKSLMCVSMRNGIEVWKEEDRMINLIEELVGGKVGFIKVDNLLINSVDITGIFDPETMQDQTRRKNGQWKCRHGTWHQKEEKCSCGDLERYKKFDCNVNTPTK